MRFGARYQRLWRALPWLVVALGLGASAALYLASQENLRERQQRYFDGRVEDVVERLKTRLETYEQVLRGLRGLFETRDDVSRSDFRRYFEQLELSDNYPGFQGMGYAAVVPAAELHRHEAAVRSEGFASYHVFPRGQRAFYTSIVYLEPFDERNQRAFGYDMYAEPVRRAAMQRAAETGAPALSGRVVLKQESEGSAQPGFLIYHAVNRSHRPGKCGEDLCNQLEGWVYAPFRMQDFMYRLMAGDHAQDLHIRIYDGESVRPESLLHSDSGPDGGGTLQTIRRLSLMGHVWTLQVGAAAGLQQRFDSRQPEVLGAGGALFSLLLGLVVWMLVYGRERAVRTAESMNEELIRERVRLSSILEGTDVGTWEWNVQTGDAHFNERWANICGYTLPELEPVSINTWLRLTHPDDLHMSEDRLKAHFDGESPQYECEVRMRHKNGHWVWVLDRGRLGSRTPDDKPLMMYGTHMDITERKKKEQSLERDVQHDQLTGLPNRLLLRDRLEQALLQAGREHKRVGLLFIDLDGFKAVNDTHGHDAGDVVLRTTSRRLQRAVRASDTVARIGGDEFVVVLPDIGDVRNALALADKASGEIELPITLTDGTSCQLSGSIGVALYPDHADTPSRLMELADQAMYRVKRHGKCATLVYDPLWPARP